MKYYLLFQVSSLVLALLIADLDIQADKPGEPNLTLTIHCPKDEIQQGDEIPIVFAIINKGKSSYSYDICDYDRGIGVCAQRYRLVAKRQDGTIVPDPRGEFRSYFGGEYSRYSGLPRGQIELDESFRKIIALNQWAFVNEPGRYTITGTYYVEGKHPSVEQIVINSDSIEIIVKPRTNKAMGDYIRELSDKLQALKKPLSKEGMQESKDILKRLAYTCDPRIVPTLIDWLYEAYWSFWAQEAFVHYLPRDPKIKNAVLEAAKKRGSVRNILYVLRQFGCTQEEFKKIINLTLTIHCPENNIKQGDEIPIVFTITNKGESPYSYDDRNGDRSGRMPEYELVAKREDGTTVLDPRKKDLCTCRIGGGLSRSGRIEPGESFSKTIALNLWALINEPGGYTVTGTYYPSMHSPAMEQMRADSEPIGITVKSRTDKEMVDYIRELSKELQKSRIPKNGWTYNSLSEMRRQREEVIKRFMYTCDRRIVPTLIDLMYENHHKNDAFWAKEGFVCYLPRDLEIKKAVLEAAKKRGLARCMQTVLEAFGCSEEEFKEIIGIPLASDNFDILGEGVGATQVHPDDEHIPALIVIATDANRPAPERPFYAIERHRAIYAIAFNRTDEGVKTLKSLLEDPDKDIRNTTEDAIRQAYKRHPVCPKFSDDVYTLELITAAGELKNASVITTFVSEIIRTRTEEGVKAIKLLLEDPNRDIPIAESDEGVKAIRNFLRNSDKDIRDMTAGIIRQVYRTYPGQPLREDDFGEEFRESFENRKKRVLEGLKNK